VLARLILSGWEAALASLAVVSRLPPAAVASLRRLVVASWAVLPPVKELWPAVLPDGLEHHLAVGP